MKELCGVVVYLINLSHAITLKTDNVFAIKINLQFILFYFIFLFCIQV